MWPMLLDYSRDECKRMLRRLELDAYSSIVSVFRAQGDLSRDKKKLLQDLQSMLSISVERHRAEVRRAVNDERLSTVADSNGSMAATSEWLIEGRRLVPLLPRLVPQTVFTQTANQAAKEAAEKNLHLINPALTGNKELANQTSVSTSTTSMASVATKPSRPVSPTSNVVVLPSGTSIHIKGMLNPDEEDDTVGRRQRRSLSIDGLGAATASTQTQTARVIYTTASSTPGSASPVKITISKSPQGRTIVSQPGGQPPKVILVTSSNQSSASTMFQRSMSVPVIRASTSTSTSQSGATRTSIIIPGSPGLAHNSSMPGVVTVTTTSITTSTSGTVTVPTSVVGGSPVFSPSINIGKPRPKVVPRQRFPCPQNKPGVVIPMGPGGPQPVAPTPQSLHNIQVKTMPKPPPIHIKQEGGMKIITQSVTGASKILPKPAQLTGSPGTPVVVVNAGPSSSATGNTTVTMVPKSVGSYATATGSKVLNITTPGGRVIATTTKASNVVTVNPKTLHLTAVKSAAGGTTVSKPNVIVVQKTQARRPQIPTQVTKGGTTVITSPAAFEKELANFIQKESGRQVSVSISPSGTVTSAAAAGGRAPEHRVIITTAGNTDPNRQGTVQKLVPTDAENRTSLLAELIQAAGIATEGGPESTGVGSNEWFEYDLAEDGGQTGTTESLPVSGVQTIMGLQNSGAKIVHRRDSVDEQPGGSQDQYYSLEQAVSLLNPETSTPEGAPILASQTMTQHIMTSSGERIVTTPARLAGKTIIEIPRRLPPSLVTSQAVVQTVRTEVDGSSRPREPAVLQQPSGELDPQTGLFYNSGVGGQQIMVNTRDGSILTSQVPSSIAPRQPPHVMAEAQAPRVSQLPVLTQPATHVLTRPAAQTVVSVPVVSQPANRAASGQPMDLLSSSLAQAQINLESYDFGEEGLDPYGALEASTAGVVVEAEEDVLSDDQQPLGAGEVVNFDAHTALLEESEAGATELLTTVHPGPPQPGHSSAALPVMDILPSAVQQKQQQQQQLSVQPTVSVSRLPARPAAFIPLEDVKGTRSSGINIITREQRDAPSAPMLQNSSAAFPTGTTTTTTTSSSSTALLSTTTTTTTSLHNSKVFAAPTASTPVPTVSISLPPSSSSSPHAQPSVPVTLPAVPQGGSSVSPLSQNTTQSSAVSVSPHNTPAQQSIGATFVSVTNDLIRTNVTPKLVAVTTSSALPQSGALESPIVGVGSDSVPRIMATANSVSPSVMVGPAVGVGGSISVLGDGHAPVVNSRVDGHKADSANVLPVGEVVSGVLSVSGASSSSSSVVEFSASASSPVGEHDINVITVGDAGSSDRSGDGLSFEANSLRQSKRKRKPPSALEEAAGGSAGGSWVRAASNILWKVCRFRGSNREKGELNAAAWFTQPVDPSDAPDYYSIIKNPMDFATIRKKLEGGRYEKFDDFHADMLLVRSNCFVYNPPDTRVCRDCTQVFNYYNQEIDRLLDKSANRLPTVHTGSPAKKIIRIDKSPGKS